CRNMVLVMQPRKYPSSDRILGGPAGGFQRGADAPPLCRRGGGVHRGGTPSKGSRPYACFWLLFARAKSNSRYGAESPGSFISIVPHPLPVWQPAAVPFAALPWGKAAKMLLFSSFVLTNKEALYIMLSD